METRNDRQEQTYHHPVLPAVAVNMHESAAFIAKATILMIGVTPALRSACRAGVSAALRR